jgi:hypothetical protein
MNLGYEFVQEIMIETKEKRILRLHLGRQNGTYRLYGEYFDSSTNEWTLVDFPSPRVSEASPLLEKCMADFNTKMAKLNDNINAVSNPCNAPFISKTEQEALLRKLTIVTTVTVN